MDVHLDCRERIEALQRSLDQAERVNQELRKAMEDLEWAAGTDRLTGAWNRRRFEEAAAKEMSLVQRRKGVVSLLLFDLDHFKQVNDTHGHTVGDIVLTQTAYILRDQMRASDALVRWGGEEFIILAPATRLEGALSLGEKVRQAMEHHRFPGVGQVTLSAGVAEYKASLDLEAWVSLADEALYQAKSLGRNRVRAGHAKASDEGVTSLLEIVWDDDYCCGDATIDEQHQRLFALANALFGATTSHQPPGEISLRLRRLTAHAAQHFRDEEALLAKARYPGVAEHGQAHQALLEKMLLLQQDSEQGRLDLAKLVDFLIMDVVQGHLLVEDKKFFRSFQNP